MFGDHGTPLVLAYAAALGGWLLSARVLRSVWPREPRFRFAHPWREVGAASLGAIGVLALGQLWIRGIRLPEEGALAPVLGAINQSIIFAPLLLVPAIRRQPLTSAWLPRPRIAMRLLVGFVLAAVAVIVYASLREGADSPFALLGRIWRYENLDKMVQVFLEDVAIAIVFVRLSAAIGNAWTVVVVATLFAAAHIPALISSGGSPADLAGLLRDAAIGSAVIAVLQRSRDIVWFWCVHYCLDMTQFARISGAG